MQATPRELPRKHAAAAVVGRAEDCDSVFKRGALAPLPHCLTAASGSFINWYYGSAAVG